MRVGIIIALGLTLAACSKDDKKAPDKATVRISFEDRSKALTQKSAFGQSDPTTMSGFNCFGVMVNYPEDSNPNFCTNDAQNSIFFPHEMAGMASISGGVLETQVKTGESRNFAVLGFYYADLASAGSCPSMFSITNFEDSLSSPFVLGTAVQNISATDSVVNINVTFNAQTQKVGDCQGPLFDWQSGGINPCQEIAGGCALWLDAHDTSTLSFTNGYVTGWSDKSGNNRHFTQSSSSMTPTHMTNVNALNNNNALYFDGSDDYMSSSYNVSSSGTIMIAFLYSTAGAKIFGSKGSTVEYIYMSVTSSSFLGAGYGNNNDATIYGNTTMATATPILGTFRFNNSNHYLYRNTSLEHSMTADGSPTTNYVYVGAINDDGNAGFHFHGGIGEVLVFNNVLSVSELAQVADYLQQKWVP